MNSIAGKYGIFSVACRLKMRPTALITIKRPAMISPHRMLLSSMKLCSTSASGRTGSAGFAGAVTVAGRKGIEGGACGGTSDCGWHVAGRLGGATPPPAGDATCGGAAEEVLSGDVS